MTGIEETFRAFLAHEDMMNEGDQDISEKECTEDARLFEAATSQTPMTAAELAAQLRVLARWVGSDPVGKLLMRLAESPACCGARERSV